MNLAVDNRQVVLLKSLRTNNRFYALVAADSGLRNAESIEDFPPSLLLGIAYPCLEDGLNDFAVIRTTFETLDVFPDDDELRGELMTMIDDSRGKLVRRLEELRDRIVAHQLHFLGTDLQEFKDYVMHMSGRGTIRRQLDSMMKVDVFESVAQTEAPQHGGSPEPMYRYEFLPQHPLQTMEGLPPRTFIGRLFDDILDAVNEDGNYQNKYVFDRNVFQKFIAVMFVNYATTDPMFYGTSREDYGVSSEKDMQETPLYQAVAKALRSLEEEFSGAAPLAPPEERPERPEAEEDLSFLFQESGGDFLAPLQGATHSVEIPFGAERRLIDPLEALADAVRLLRYVEHPRAAEIRRICANSGRQIFKSLQELQVISPLVTDPFDDGGGE